MLNLLFVKLTLNIFKFLFVLTGTEFLTWYDESEATENGQNEEMKRLCKFFFITLFLKLAE